MIEWKECKLGDIINLKRGYDLPGQDRKNGCVPIYSSSGITDFHSIPSVKGPGVITGRYGTIGQVFYSCSDYWPLNTTLYVQDFKGNDPKFIYYFLRTLDFEKYSDKSAVPGINRNDLHAEIICIPDIDVQESIAVILSSLDDKIDLLHRQNKTLESMGETLFRNVFVDEKQAAWKECTVGNLSEHIKTNTHPNNTPDAIFYHYSIPAFDDLHMPMLERGAMIQSNKYKVITNTILFSKLNPHKDKRLWLITGEIPDVSVCSTEFQVLKPKANELLFFGASGFLMGIYKI
jgi:type I restriction enzyme S subunit